MSDVLSERKEKERERIFISVIIRNVNQDENSWDQLKTPVALKKCIENIVENYTLEWSLKRTENARIIPEIYYETL